MPKVDEKDIGIAIKKIRRERIMKNKFLQGTVILLITSVLLRGLGFVYQILVVRYAGTESVGILNMGFPFYIILVVLATARNAGGHC